MVEAAVLLLLVAAVGVLTRRTRRSGASPRCCASGPWPPADLVDAEVGERPREVSAR